MDNKLIIKFKTPYNFEGSSYTEVDLTGLEELSVTEMIAAEKEFMAKGNTPLLQEMSMEYACILANKVTGKPIEFFKQMPLKHGIKLKNTVTSFFYNED